MEDSSSNTKIALDYLQVIVSCFKPLYSRHSKSKFEIFNKLKSLCEEENLDDRNLRFFPFFDDLEMNLRKLNFICVAPDVVEEINPLDTYIIDALKNIDIVYILQFLFALFAIQNFQEDYESCLNKILCLENIPQNCNSEMLINLHEEINCTSCMKNISLKTSFISQTFESELLLSKIDQNLFLIAASRPSFKLNDLGVKTNCQELEGKMFEIFTEHLNDKVKSNCNTCGNERVHEFKYDKLSKFYFLTLSWVAENINHQSSFISVISVSHNIQINESKYKIKLLILRNRDGYILAEKIEKKKEYYWKLGENKYNWNEIVLESIKNRYFVEAILYKKSKKGFENKLKDYVELEKTAYECDLYEYYMGKTVKSDIPIKKCFLKKSDDDIVGKLEIN